MATGQDMVRVSPRIGSHEEESRHLSEFGLIGFVALAALTGRVGFWKPFFRFDAFSFAGAVVGSYPILRETAVAIRRLRMTMELSMSIAVVAALAIGEPFTAAVIVLFVLVAEVLEELTVRRGSKAIEDLLPLLPDFVFLRDTLGTRRVSISELRIGDVIQVKPGSRIPVDGTVMAGHSFVNQAAITGESLPAEKVVGAWVYAGTTNQFGVLDIRVHEIGGDTVFGGILLTVEEARRSRAPVQKIADRLAGYLVVFALGSALVTFGVTRSIRASISVIIVAGACGVAAGTPLAILGAMGQAARLGCIVRDARALEALGRINTVVLDKTGTLTLGMPDVVAIHPAEGVEARAVIEAASIAERSSEHPLADAVLRKASEMQVRTGEPERFEYEPGRGIRCFANGGEILAGTGQLLEQSGIAVDTKHSVRSRILVAREGRFLGGLEIADVLRPEAKAAISAFRRMRVLTLLFTGDSRNVARDIGTQLGVDQIEFELLPEDKLRSIQTLRSSGRRVAMVGDGINDAPALAGADVGIAMGSGTDIARETADVLLLGNNLLRFAETVRVARHCRAIIFENFAGTVFVDLVGIGLASAGILKPLSAAAIHVTSELLFLLNSARLLTGGKSSG